MTLRRAAAGTFLIYALRVTRPLATIIAKRDVDALERRRFTVELLGALALVACAIGVVIGVRVAVSTRHVLCNSIADHVRTCVRHPRTEGVVIVLISIVLAVLVVVTSIAVRFLLEARARELGR